MPRHPVVGWEASRQSIVLSLANGNHDHEALKAFADGAAAATGGTVTIEFEDAAHAGEVAYESAIIDDVAAGTYDLGWAAPRPWHAKGVTSFDALMAPFLVDSYALQRAVLESDLEQEMLAGLDGTGLVGLGILPGPMRRVATAEGGFRAPGDLRGKLIGIQQSDIATHDVRGARCVDEGHPRRRRPRSAWMPSSSSWVPWWAIAITRTFRM